MPENCNDPILLTPGPLTTDQQTRAAMMSDLGSRDQRFIRATREIRQRLVELIDGKGIFECVPVQGSGTFAVEAMLTSLTGADDHLLILVNGAYGRRMVDICRIHGIAHEVMEWRESEPVNVQQVKDTLEKSPNISKVVVVHCETTTGILNPLESLSHMIAASGRGLLIDAMSSFGALEIDQKRIRFDALAASSNKCLEGVPGLGYCLVRQSLLESSKGNADTLVLDLYQQWQGLESNGQWRFTPPTHVLLGLHKALELLDEEGGVVARYARYRENCQILVEGMRQMGFETLLGDDLQAPIIITFKMPADARFEFESFYNGLAERGFVIYPGKLTEAESFRMGCIGALNASHMQAALGAVESVLKQMGVASPRP